MLGVKITFEPEIEADATRYGDWTKEIVEIAVGIIEGNFVGMILGEVLGFDEGKKELGRKLGLNVGWALG